MGDMV